MPEKAPKPLNSLGKDGAKLWRTLHKSMSFEERDYPLVQQLCESWELSRRCQRSMDEEGLLVEGRYGLRENPCCRLFVAAVNNYRLCARELGMVAKLEAITTTPEPSVLKFVAS